MSPTAPPIPTGLRSFRLRLMVAMMLMVLAITGLGLYVAERNLAATVERELQLEFQSGLDALHGVQELRHAALGELCRTLVQKPRIFAALEADAQDILYPVAKDELRDVMTRGGQRSSRSPLKGAFYRFLDLNGKVIPAPNGPDVGELRAEEESRLAVPGLSRTQQLGYLVRRTREGREEVAEVIVMPILSIDTDEAIAALALGFNPVEPGSQGAGKGIRSGIWLDGRLYFPSISQVAQAALGSEVTRVLASTNRTDSIAVSVEDEPHLLFYRQLNPGSVFAPAYEVCTFPLTDLQARQRQLRGGILGASAIILLAGLAASHLFSIRLSRPVEKLAVDSEENRTQRDRAEAQLEVTHEGLQRSIRFSADASHQLKTPVTVLRAGLEELLAQDKSPEEVRQELANLVHQTYRLTSVVDDLLLLSQADAGRLPITFRPVDLTRLIAAGLDDLGAMVDGVDVAIETDVPATLWIAGEERYSAIIVQNLFENARKYNHAGGRLRVSAREQDGEVLLTVGNTGQPIRAEMREHVFERFHRGSVGEDVPGHGLGLNLARELARLQGGELKLVRSDELWTEFEVRFRRAAGRGEPEAGSGEHGAGSMERGAGSLERGEGRGESGERSGAGNLKRDA